MSNAPVLPQQASPTPPEELAHLEFRTLDGSTTPGPFLTVVLEAAQKAASGQGILVIQQFEPEPLYRVMQEMGWKHITRQITPDEYHVYFYREERPRVNQPQPGVAASQGRVPMVLQSATPIVWPIILRMQQSPALRERVEFTEVKVWEETEKHLAWIVRGKADISFSALMAVAKLLNRNELKLASVDVWDNFYLLTRDPHVSSFADLRGQTIQLPLVKNSPPGRVTTYLMQATGMDPSDFHFLFGKEGDPFGRPEEIVHKLVTGEIAAAVLREPEASYALTQNPNLRVAVSYGELWRQLHPQSPGLPNAGVVIKEAFWRRHPDIVQLFLTELEKAIDWVNAHPREAAQMSYQAMGHTLPEVERFLQRAHFRHVPACDVLEDLQTYLQILDPKGHLQLRPEDCDLTSPSTSG